MFEGVRGYKYPDRPNDTYFCKDFRTIINMILSFEIWINKHIMLFGNDMDGFIIVIWTMISHFGKQLINIPINIDSHFET